MPTLYLASTNPGKLHEFRQAARARGYRVEALPGIEGIPPCIEDGTTFEANARKKALHYSSYVDGLVFADDSGICVDALGGAPCVYSARYAGPDATDAQNNRRLLEELRKTETARQGETLNRVAHYECVIALAERGRLLTTVEGRAEGVIIDEPRGSNGFGYDPYFFFPPLGRTFAEISADQKFSVSHRGQAFRKLLDFLERTC
jgi:XTP/dITP diphosphohydrolase